MTFEPKSKQTVEAARYVPGMEDGFIIEFRFYGKSDPMPRTGNRVPAVRTPQGDKQVTKHDYIITKSDGTKLVMDRDDFEANYQPVRATREA